MAEAKSLRFVLPHRIPSPAELAPRAGCGLARGGAGSVRPMNARLLLGWAPVPGGGDVLAARPPSGVEQFGSSLGS